MSFVTRLLKELASFVVLAVVIVLPIRLFVAQPFIVEGASMVPTFDDGQYLIVDELTYRFAEPKRDDVIIFRYPVDPSFFFIKRIIGLPGETVRISEGAVSIQKPGEEPFTLEESYISSKDAAYSLTRKLGDDEYFVMGDNRPKSSDSRIWGALPRANISGRAFVRLLPLDKIGILPGAVVPETK